MKENRKNGKFKKKKYIYKKIMEDVQVTNTSGKKVVEVTEKEVVEIEVVKLVVVEKK